jgi:hypothetical protein
MVWIDDDLGLNIALFSDDPCYPAFFLVNGADPCVFKDFGAAHFRTLGQGLG